MRKVWVCLQRWTLRAKRQKQHTVITIDSNQITIIELSCCSISTEVGPFLGGGEDISLFKPDVLNVFCPF